MNKDKEGEKLVPHHAESLQSGKAGYKRRMPKKGPLAKVKDAPSCLAKKRIEATALRPERPIHEDSIVLEEIDHAISSPDLSPGKREDIDSSCAQKLMHEPAAKQNPKPDSKLREHIKARKYSKQFFEKSRREQIGLTTLAGPRRETTVMQFGKLSIEEAGGGEFDRPPASLDSNEQIPDMDTLLNTIDKNTSVKVKLEKAIIEFNSAPGKAFDYLWKEQILGKEPELVADFLLLTPGLCKEKIGEYLGNHHEYNVSVLKAYAAKIDFVAVPVDEAMRLYLSLFRLPKESQQIDRTLEAFSNSYYDQNPELFKEKDNAYVLAYSLIFLNTMNHNPKVDECRKITKDQFIKFNEKSLNPLTKEYFGDIYDRIVKDEFKTDTDELEKIYDRLSMFKTDEDSDVSSKDMLKMTTHVITTGDVFLKYGRMGSAHNRHVFLSENQQRLCWQDKERTGTARFISTVEIRDVELGSTRTKVFQRYNIPAELDERCFSIISISRTLDLQARSKEVRSTWVKYFRLIARENNKRREKSEEYKRIVMEKKSKLNEDLDTIWENDILANFANHWDYENHCPKMCPILAPTKKGVLARMFSCCSRKKKENDFVEIPSDAYTSKGYFLDSVWRKGIPPRFRKKMWPFAIRNNLEVSRTLYDLLVGRLSRNEHELEQIIMHKPGTDQRLIAKIKGEVDQTLAHFHSMAGRDFLIAENGMMRVLQAFLLYRPDFGYSQNMCYLAGMFLSYCTELDAFVCYSNFLHSHHFLAFFKGHIKELKLRINIFNDYFKNLIPDLYHYFQVVDVTTDLFLIDWMLTLYSKHMDPEIAARIWDCFMLDGEVFAIKVGIGVLKYFENVFLKETHYNIMETLKNMRKKVDEDRLFDIIEGLKISGKDYMSEIQKQSWAQKKSQILQSLFLD